MKSRNRGVVNIRPPWEPPLTEISEHVAIRALNAGTADERQQRMVIDWLIKCTGIAQMTYHPESDRDSAFAEGKRHVGRMFFNLAQTDTRPDKE